METSSWTPKPPNNVANGEKDFAKVRNIFYSLYHMSFYRSPNMLPVGFYTIPHPEVVNLSSLSIHKLYPGENDNLPKNTSLKILKHHNPNGPDSTLAVIMDVYPKSLVRRKTLCKKASLARKAIKPSLHETLYVLDISSPEHVVYNEDYSAKTGNEIIEDVLTRLKYDYNNDLDPDGVLQLLI